MIHHDDETGAVVRFLPPEQRRRWVRSVLSSRELTHAQKTVLVALETYADYRDGTNAHPGEENLAQMCDLKPRAVRYALARAQQLGFIEQTSPANPKAGKASVYRLLSQATTGTAMPVNNSTTGTTVPVNNASTGTAMPVETRITGTVKLHHRHGDDISTGTTVPPTNPVPSNHQGVSPDWGTSPRAVELTHTSVPPPRFCDRHPHGYRGRCGDCANARTAFEAWQAEQAAQDVALAQVEDLARRRPRRLAENCPDCAGTNWRPDPHREDFTIRCEHPAARLTDHA